MYEMYIERMQRYFCLATKGDSLRENWSLLLLVFIWYYNHWNRRGMEREATRWPYRTGYGRNTTIKPWGQCDTNNLHAWARIHKEEKDKTSFSSAFFATKTTADEWGNDADALAYWSGVGGQRRGADHNNQSVRRRVMNSLHAGARRGRKRIRHLSLPRLLILTKYDPCNKR